MRVGVENMVDKRCMRRLASVGCAGMGLIACGSPPVPPAPAAPPPVATIDAIDEGIEPETEPPGAEEPPPLPGELTEIELAPGKRCELAWEAGGFRAVDDGWVITSIRRIGTREGGACRAGIFFDGVAEAAEGCTDGAADALCEPEPLDGGVLPKSPPLDEHRGMDLADMNFDGYRDLCVQAFMGAYNYSQRCFLFRPAEGRFERYEPLDDIIWMSLDPDAKQIRHGLRLGGPAYMDQVLGWENGDLVVLTRTETVLGERPDGQPLPPGHSRYEIVYERRGGQLVKIREGPAKSP